MFFRKAKEEKEGDLGARWVINPPGKAKYYPVETVDEAVKMLTESAERDLKNKRLHMNDGVLQVFRDGEWERWYDEEGNGIDDVIEEIEERPRDLGPDHDVCTRGNGGKG